MRYASLRPALDPLLPTVEKPGRYVGIERNVTRKDLASASVTLALAFPDTYEIGMSHTGLKILYEIVNRREEFACERVYAPWTDLEEKAWEKGSIVCRCITSVDRSDGNALHGRPRSFPCKGGPGRAFGLTVAWERSRDLGALIDRGAA